MTGRKQRSRDGCWTCKDRRRKCDGRRPICQNCEDRQVQCEGYDVRLQWGFGIASRGRYTGAEKPVNVLAPVRPTGRRRDRERKQRQMVAGKQSNAPLVTSNLTDSIQSDDNNNNDSGDSSVVDFDQYQVQDPVLAAQLSSMVDDEQLFEQFLTYGIHVLHSTATDDADQLLASRLPTLCAQSKALYAVCLTFQASLNDEHQPRFYEYFDRALSAFRAELNACTSYLEDATWAAGLLLCSVGFYHGLPWTIHLQGMYAILETHGFNDNSVESDPFRNHLLEVMGVMDLPSFAVGRQAPCIGIWRRHCRKSTVHNNVNRDTVEFVSGLPRSLLDLFSGIGEESTEQDFWDWPGSPGTLLQSQLWEAYRLAGMLTIRHRHIPSALGSAPDWVRSNSTSNTSKLKVVPTTEVLVTRILSHIQAIVQLSEADNSARDELVANAINYPIFVAGLEAAVLKANEEWQALIIGCFTIPFLAKNHGAENRLLLELLQELWQCNGDVPNVDDLARARGKELGLL